MKTTSRKGQAGFTLIELMAVITIIVILAGLVIGGLGYVSENQAKSKAQVQIAQPKIQGGRQGRLRLRL